MILIPKKIEENLVNFGDLCIGDYFLDSELNLFLKINHKTDEHNVVWMNYGVLQSFAKDEQVTEVIVDHTVSPNE